MLLFSRKLVQNMKTGDLEKLARAIESRARVEGKFGFFPNCQQTKSNLRLNPSLTRYAIACHFEDLCTLAIINNVKQGDCMGVAEEIIEFLAIRWHISLDKNWRNEHDDLLA
jgi:hypothetical protein